MAGLTSPVKAADTLGASSLLQTSSSMCLHPQCLCIIHVFVSSMSHDNNDLPNLVQLAQM